MQILLTRAMIVPLAARFSGLHVVARLVLAASAWIVADCRSSRRKRARSAAEFVAKLKIVEEESDESMLWIDRLRTAKLPGWVIADAERLRDMFDQIVAMTVKSIKTTKARHLTPPPSRRHRKRS